MVDTTHPGAPSAAAFEIVDAHFVKTVSELAALCAVEANPDEIARMAFDTASAELAGIVTDAMAAEIGAALTARVAQHLEAMQPTGRGAA